MTQQTINLGTADKGNGDVLRTAFGKVNANFAELYNQIATSVVVGATAPTGPEEGALWWNSESGRMYVYYGTAWVDASPVDGAGISSTNELVNGGNTVSLGSDGKLTLPNGVKITPIAFAGIDLEVGTKIWNFGTDGRLTLPNQGKIGPTDVNSFLTFNWGDDVELKGGDNLYLSGSVATIRTNGNANQWIFGTNGSLTFPDSTTQSTAWTGSVSSLVNGARTLSLDSDSTLTLPNFDILAGIGSKIKSALDIKIQAGAYYLSNLVQVEAGIWYLEFLISSAPDWATMVAVGDSVVSGTCVRQITDVSTPNAGQWRITVSGDFTGAGDPSSWSFYKPGATGSIWTFGNDGALTFPDTTAQTTAWTGITGFGEGFSLTAADKIVTNKLYSTNLTQPTQHYRLELDTNGVVVLPDGSIINGSTIRGVAGTGELNYTGITIGPNSNDAEKTWMWVDHANAYITTNNAANTWTFGNDGLITFPGANGFRATFGSVEPIGDVLHSVNSLYLESEATVGLTSGADVAELESTYLIQEELFANLRDQDEQSGSSRPWVGLPSYEAYDLIMAYNEGVGLPLPGSLAPAAYSAKIAYYSWQTARTNAGVLINVADKQWVFGVAGDLRVPGTISKTNILQLNSSGTGGGAGKAASVSIDGNNGRLLVRTSDDVANKDWTFNINGTTTFPSNKISPESGIDLTVQTTNANTTISNINHNVYAAFDGYTTIDNWNTGYFLILKSDFPDADVQIAIGDRIENSSDATDYASVIIGVIDGASGTWALPDRWVIPISSNSKSWTAAKLYHPDVINDWTFGSDGILTFPESIYGYSRVQSTGGFEIDGWHFGEDGDNVLSLPVRPGQSYAQINAGTGAVQQQFLFGLDGSLTLPDNSVIASYKPVTVIAAPTGVQSITDSASAAPLLFIDTVDTTTAFANGVFTVPYTGYYQFNVNVYFTSNVTITDGFLFIADTTNEGLDTLDTLYYGPHTGRIINGSSMLLLTAGHTVRLFFYQLSGGPVDIGSSSRLTIHRVSIS